MIPIRACSQSLQLLLISSTHTLPLPQRPASHSFLENVQNEDLAAAAGNLAMVQLLVYSGALSFASHPYNRVDGLHYAAGTPYDLSVENGHHAVALFLDTTHDLTFPPADVISEAQAAPQLEHPLRGVAGIPWS